MEKVVIDGKPHLFLKTIYDIPKDSELRYDYNFPDAPWRKVPLGLRFVFHIRMFDSHGSSNVECMHAHCYSVPKKEVYYISLVNNKQTGFIQPSNIHVCHTKIANLTFVALSCKINMYGSTQTMNGIFFSFCSIRLTVLFVHLISAL